MSDNKYKNELEYVLTNYFYPGASSSSDDIISDLNKPNYPDRANIFKEQLNEAILTCSISPAELERMTGVDFETQEEADDYLRNYVWKTIYIEPAPIKE